MPLRYEEAEMSLFIIIGVSAHIELKGYAIVLSSMTTILTFWIANGFHSIVKRVRGTIVLLSNMLEFSMGLLSDHRSMLFCCTG